MSTSSAIREWRGGALRTYFSAVLVVLLAMIAAMVFRRLPHANLSLVFLLAVLIVAAVWGLWPSIFASVLSFIALNFFFTAPLYTLTVEEEGDVATLIFFLAMAALTGNLAARMRAEMASNRAALDRVSTLLDFSRRMTAVANAEAALKALVDRLATMYQAPVTAYLNEPGEGLRRRSAGHWRGNTLSVDAGALTRIWKRIAADPIIDGRQTFIPLSTSGAPIGLVAIGCAEGHGERRELTASLCEQASIAVERVLLVDNLKQAQVVSETEQLRSALLSSVSHDLRTPLASIIGSTTSILEYRDKLSPEDRGELLRTVLDESQRLNRYIQNLLDMTRLGQASFKPNRDWVDLNDLISAAIERLGAALQRVDVKVQVPPAVSLIYVHGALIEQALVNLLDNAADFAPPGDVLEVNARLDAQTTTIDVIDHGPGIAASERELVFDMFYRAKQGDRRRQGVGLGLAICRSLVAAHGGTIEALEVAGGGTCMRIALPIGANPVSSAHA